MFAIADNNPEQPHCLVLVFLRGGADSLTLLPPMEDDAYFRARPQTSVRKVDALPLDGLFGLHPALRALHPLYAEGELLLLQGAGSEDDTRSHFEAQDLMEHGGSLGGGWLGRFLQAQAAAERIHPDREHDAGALCSVAMGKAMPASLRGAPGTLVLESLQELSLGEAPPGYVQALESLYAADSGALGNAGGQTIAGLRRLWTLQAENPPPSHGAIYPQDEFGLQLMHVAQLLRARVGLRAAVLDLGGWDSHFGTQAVLPPLMTRLAEGLAAFHKDLGPRQMERTTVVVKSEFGRRVYENTSLGTDHGRGGFMALLGNGVRGGRVLHHWEGLLPQVLEGTGDLPVHFNFRDVIAPILRRLAQDLDPERVFPNHAFHPVEVA